MIGGCMVIKEIRAFFTVPLLDVSDAANEVLRRGWTARESDRESITYSQTFDSESDFDSELAEGVFMSTAPGHPRTEYAGEIYPNIFAPWPGAVEIDAEDEIHASLRFNAVKDDYVWQWNTRIEAGDSRRPKAEFRQSNFNSRFLSAADLHKRAPTHRPRLNRDGIIARTILELMGDGLTHAELAQIVTQRFPQEFSDEKEALQTAADLAERFCD